MTKGFVTILIVVPFGTLLSLCFSMSLKISNIEANITDVNTNINTLNTNIDTLNTNINVFNNSVRSRVGIGNSIIVR